MTLALATLGELPEDGAAWAPRRAAGRDAARGGRAGRARGHGVPAFMRNYDMRPALHEDDGHVSGAWMRAREPRALDAPLPRR